MRHLQPQLTRQGILGLFLCLSAWLSLAVTPSPAGAALAFLCVILFWSQLNFAQAHVRAEQAARSTRAAFEALPDAVVVANVEGVAAFSKEVVAPRPPVLPLVLGGGRVQSPELLAGLDTVIRTKQAQQMALRLDDGRMLECRMAPIGDDALVILRDITESHRDSERIRYLATHDSLTGLLNRNSFHLALEQAIARANRSKRPFGLLFLDLDHFKAVNDTLGHGAGDALLREVATRLSRALRKSDSAYRLAGDEFTVIVENLEAERDVEGIADKLCGLLAQPYFDADNAPRVTASVGAVTYPRDGATPDELLRLADKAMYRAKAAGRNTAEIHF